MFLFINVSILHISHILYDRICKDSSVMNNNMNKTNKKSYELNITQATRN